jgi:hypothetical protein
MKALIGIIFIVGAIGFFIEIISSNKKSNKILKSYEKNSQSCINEEEYELWPYYKKRPLSFPEQNLYFKLVRALPNNVILAQVQLSRIIGVKSNAGFNEWNNKINRMSLDYVVCKKDFSIVAAIELDDSSHEREDRIIADRKKNKALNDAGITLYRWSIKNIPSEEKIKELLNTETNEQA